MNAPDARRLIPGTITIQMRLHNAAWSYDNELPVQFVDVEVEIRALLRLSIASSGKYVVSPTLSGNRHLVELAAQGIIDREGPNFSQPVRVRAVDVYPQLSNLSAEASLTGDLEANRLAEVGFV